MPAPLVGVKHQVSNGHIPTTLLNGHTVPHPPTGHRYEHVAYIPPSRLGTVQIVDRSGIIKRQLKRGSLKKSCLSTNSLGKPPTWGDGVVLYETIEEARETQGSSSPSPVSNWRPDGYDLKTVVSKDLGIAPYLDSDSTHLGPIVEPRRPLIALKKRPNLPVPYDWLVTLPWTYETWLYASSCPATGASSYVYERMSPALSDNGRSHARYAAGAALGKRACVGSIAIGLYGATTSADPLVPPPRPLKFPPLPRHPGQHFPLSVQDLYLDTYESIVADESSRATLNTGANGSGPDLNCATGGLDLATTPVFASSLPCFFNTRIHEDNGGSCGGKIGFYRTLKGRSEIGAIDDAGPWIIRDSKIDGDLYPTLSTKRAKSSIISTRHFSNEPSGRLNRYCVYDRGYATSLTSLKGNDINQLVSATQNLVHSASIRIVNLCKWNGIQKYDTPNSKFLVSFMVDARGGAMRGCRHSGIRVIVPPRKAPGPLRVTCRFVKKEKMANPPPLMEGEGLACRVLELGPAGTKFLGPVIIEIPHFASLRGNEREITILRSDNGENWREHVLEASETAVQEVLNESFDGEDALDDLHTTRITRILTNDFPLYFAIVTRIHQETHTIGPEGGIISSTIVPMVQAMFPEGALTKRIRIGLQAHPISPDMVSKMLGNRVAVSPVVTIEPRRRKFHKPITLTIPLPQASTKGMINQYNNGGDAPTLRLLCSITGGTTPAQWEDITGSTPLTFVNDYVSFTTTVSARFWLMDCRQVSEATKFATEVYREATHVPYMARMLVYAKRRDANEALLRAFTVTDDKMEKTLEEQEHFTEVAQSRDVEVLDNKLLYVEMVGNLIPVTKTDHRHLVETGHPSNGHNGHQNHVSATPTQNVASSPSTHALATNGHHEPHEPSNQYENMLTTTSASYLATKFRPFQENRLPFRVRIKDPEQEPMGRLMFLREPHRSGANVRSSIGSSAGTDLLPPICTLNIVLPDQIITDSMETEVRNPWTKSFLHELGIGRDVILNPDLMADKISRHVQGNWIRLAHELNFPQHEIEDIQTEFPQNPGHQAKAMIVAWKRKTEHLPENESRVTLERALRSINRDDVVQSCGLGSERPKANGAIPSSPVIRDQKKGTGLDQLDKSLDDSLDRYGYEEYKEGGHSSTDHPSHPASSFHDGFHAQEEHLSSSPEEAPKKEESPVTPVAVKPKVPPPPTSERSHPEKIALLQKMVADTVDDHNVPPIRPPRKGEQGLDGVEKPIVSETTIVSQDKKTKGQIPTQEFVVESEEPKTPRSSPEPRKTDLTFPTVASPSEGVKGLSDEIQSRLQIHSDKTESESDQQDPDSSKPPPTTTTVLKSSHFRAATPSDASEDQYETEYEREGESVLKRLKIMKSVKTRTIVRDGKEETETFEETLYDDGRGHPVPFEDLDPELREKVSQFLLAESPSDPGAREIKGNE